MVVAKAPHFPDNRINRTAYDEAQPTHEQSTSSQGRLDNGQNLSLSPCDSDPRDRNCFEISRRRFVKTIATFPPSKLDAPSNERKEK